MIRIQWFVILLAVLTGCQVETLSMQERGPSRRVFTGNQRTLYTFDEGATWDIFTVDDNQAYFQLDDGALETHVAADRGYVISTNNVQYDDVIVNAKVQQTNGLLGNGFGVVCRADKVGNGYYFLLASTGEFTISVGTPARNALFELVPWQYHSRINPGVRENEIRAVCVENYLAMFINNVFVAEAFDDEFTVGELGVAIGAVGQPATARFDNILIRDARIAGSR